MKNKIKSEPHKCDYARDLFDMFLLSMDELHQNKQLLEKGFEEGEDDFLVRISVMGLLKIINPIYEKYPLFMSFYDKDIYLWALKIQKEVEIEFGLSQSIEIKEDLPEQKNKVS